MIKVGDIYRDDEGWIMCVTLSSPVDVYVIYNNGSIGNWNSTKDFLSNKTYIMNYPTWQEAVNSKEFNDD